MSCLKCTKLLTDDSEPDSSVPAGAAAEIHATPVEPGIAGSYSWEQQTVMGRCDEFSSLF